MSLRTFLLGGYWRDRSADAAVIATPRGPLAVRPVTLADASLVKAFVEGLSPESRYNRFFQSFQTMPPSLLDRFVGIDVARHVALVAVAAADGKPAIVGEARYCLEDDFSVADVALAVDDHWQGLGVGRGLLQLLERRAANKDILHLKGEVLAGNNRMIEFARNRGFQIWPDDEDRRLLRIAKTLMV